MSGVVDTKRPHDAWALPATHLYTLQLTSCSDVAPYFKQCNLKAMQASLQQPDLWYEALLLRRLMYKNHSQHRGAHLMRRLRAVSRQLRLLEALALPNVISDLDHMTQLASAPAAAAKAVQGRAGPPGSNRGFGLGGSSSASQTHNVPCQEACALAMGRMLVGGRLAQGLVSSCVEAAEQLAAQVAKSFFMPLCITGIAMLARIQALSMQHVMACITAYNSLAGLLPLLPCSSNPASNAAAKHAELLNNFPQSLQCSWHEKLPHIVGAGEPVDLAASVQAISSRQPQPHWVQVQAQQLWEDLGLMQGLEATYVGPDIAHTLQQQDTAGEQGIIEANKPSVAHAAEPALAQLQPAADAAVIATAGQPQGPVSVANPPNAAGWAVVAPGSKQGKRKGAVASMAPTAPTAGMDVGVKVSRQSFFDMMAAPKPGGQKAATSVTSHSLPAAQLATQPLNVFIDRGPAAAKRKRAGQAAADPAAESAGLVTTDTPATVAPVYMAAGVGMLGPGLGLTIPATAETATGMGLGVPASEEPAAIHADMCADRNTQGGSGQDEEPVVPISYEVAAGSGGMQLGLGLSANLPATDISQQPATLATEPAVDTGEAAQGELGMATGREQQQQSRTDGSLPLSKLQTGSPLKPGREQQQQPLQQQPQQQQQANLDTHPGHPPLLQPQNSPLLKPARKKTKVDAPAFMRVGQGNKSTASSLASVLPGTGTAAKLAAMPTTGGVLGSWDDLLDPITELRTAYQRTHSKAGSTPQQMPRGKPGKYATARVSAATGGQATSAKQVQPGKSSKRDSAGNGAAAAGKAAATVKHAGGAADGAAAALTSDDNSGTAKKLKVAGPIASFSKPGAINESGQQAPGKADALFSMLLGS